MRRRANLLWGDPSDATWGQVRVHRNISVRAASAAVLEPPSPPGHPESGGSIRNRGRISRINSCASLPSDSICNCVPAYKCTRARNFAAADIVVRVIPWRLFLLSFSRAGQCASWSPFSRRPRTAAIRAFWMCRFHRSCSFSPTYRVVRK
jgi:hypothetical protein